ncbi:ankyrin repeat and SOCS box protein 14 isoform X2 [Protopterus annectens]|uniref:ankyrin repeat and SOCS box protein 14 isoform X2 n=1 Tax=Protopterus annectens TaxID=7888 RepID=UPI001CFC0479|nr:ankyrin repeat and SOCS box protein 14 isoform X2 [Protopterus annectens]
MDNFLAVVDDDDDVTTQYAAEQSMRDYYRQRNTVTEVHQKSVRRILSPEHDDIVTAIRSGQEESLQKLTDKTFAFNEADQRGWLPLHEAAVQLNKNILELTFEASNPTVREQTTLKGETPLFLAISHGLVENSNFLLLNGCNANAADWEGDSPLVIGADAKSQAADGASVMFEAAAGGNPDALTLLLDYGADANVSNHSGHLPIHRAAYRGHYQALAQLISVTDQDTIEESGMSPLHSAAAGGHPDCLQLLIKEGFDVNFMLHHRVRKGYDDERKSALYFAVSNGDTQSARLLLEARALPNQDPVKCLQVALRMGNYDLINLLLLHGANVNYFCRVNTTHFPSALQYALKDEVTLRMLLNYGYDVHKCFDCCYGDLPHFPDGYEGWTPAVIKDTMFCEVISLIWLKHLSGKLVRIMLDYTDYVKLCSKLKATITEQKEWPDIQHLLSNTRSLKHLCRLKIRKCMGRLHLRCPVFMTFLHLPKRLKDYILYKEYDLYGQGRLTALH